ncbi:ABC transporter, ATP-binding protein [Oesophagostomum dentatum]|uniref:ABC transporter, ATP-binding protein n=1 Tax=Oesophagostomum dentatum TaxID=61180 RepID=A0A0B1TPR2_OESDE|nr:ABC transporter, ATP-binding protein [Oesophagostomum dentatum]
MIGDKLTLLFFILWRKLFGSQIVASVNIAYPIVQSLAIFMVMIMMNKSRLAGLSNPGVIFCVWLVFAVCGAPEFYAWITLGTDQSVRTSQEKLVMALVGQLDFEQYVCYLAFYPLLLLQLLLNCFSDPSPYCNGKNYNYTEADPETAASFPNRQVLWWFSPIVSKASNGILQIEDLFDLDEGLQADNLNAQWEQEWNKSLKDYEVRKSSRSANNEFYVGEDTPLILSNGKSYGTDKLVKADEEDEVPLPSIIGALWRLFKWELLGGSIIKLFSDLIQFANPAFLRRQKTQGEIVNLMAIDVDRFRMITPQLQQYWSSPLQISLIPLNICMSLISKKWTVQQMHLKDERIRMTNEVLSGIKVVKLYAWEPALEDAVDEIRVKEMALVRKAGVLKTLADMLNIAAPFLVALVTFTTYTLTSPDHVLTPQIAFVSLTLFNQLRGPLMMAADLISQTVQVVVSNKRLKDFLIAEELPAADIDRDEHNDYPVSAEMSSAAFAWDRHERPQLHDLYLKVPTGQLLAVVGTVGAGKSSLLLSLLGEMEKLRGYVGLRGMVAYVPQQPWIRNGTLVDNIIMEKTFDKAFYDTVLEACALRQDLAQLPNGDQTEIGEKGVNLSGGQKARISLARAVYQDRDVYLLDDPLSAVDAHVSKHIFNNVIGPNGLLAKKTRFLFKSLLIQSMAIASFRRGV